MGERSRIQMSRREYEMVVASATRMAALIGAQFVPDIDRIEFVGDAAEPAPDILTRAMKRPLPTLAQWLDDNGDGTRGDGFDAFADQIARTLERGALPHYDEDAKSLLRLYTGIAIAVIECCNIEVQKGRQPESITQLMPRALAMAAMYATASTMKAETPWRQVAKVLTEEFRWAAKEAADDLPPSPSTVKERT